MSNLTYYFNLACPVKTKLLKDRNNIGQKWITKDIVQLRVEVRDSFKKWKESGLKSDKSFNRKIFKKIMKLL